MHKFFVLTPHSYEKLIGFVRLLFGELKKKIFYIQERVIFSTFGERAPIPVLW